MYHYFIMMMLFQYFHVCVEILHQPRGSKMTSIVFNGYKKRYEIQTMQRVALFGNGITFQFILLI